MYSLEDKKKAVDLLIKYDFAYTQVMRELGYPNSRTTLNKWNKELKETGKLKVCYKRKSKYSEKEKIFAVNYYLEHGKNISRTIRIIRYPTRVLLARWIDELAFEDKKISRAGGVVVKFNQKEKEDAVLGLVTREETADIVADSHQVSRTSLYKWSKSLLTEEGYDMAIHKNKEKNKSLNENGKDSEEKDLLLENLDLLRIENERLRFENDILVKASEVLKKDVGINLNDLNNCDKTSVINALRNKYSLQRLLVRLDIAKSSYFYQVSIIDKEDKYSDIREDIISIFNTAYKAYGYRRIYKELIKKGDKVSEKVIRRLMGEEGLIIKSSKKKKYNSYLGEISPAVENLLERDFSAENPNEKWLTDLSEFAIPAGKVYLSPIIDCFDGLPVSWTISTSPNAKLANTMLEQAITTLKEDEKPIVHSDCGGHYRWPGWIDLMDKANLIRSMSKKGCSPDNSACEGFFGTIKQEMFYNRTWGNVSIENFVEYLNTYLEWYSNDRIKSSLNYMSPIEYRKSLGLLF
ncbi:MAG: IS3 family transposase [Clostridium sp.]|nr:IS3 family transposase [Clostridium sp.]